MDSTTTIIKRMMDLGKYSKQESLAVTLGISPGTLSDYKGKSFIQPHLIHKFIQKHPEINEIELCYGTTKATLHSSSKERILEEILEKTTKLELLNKESVRITSMQTNILNEILSLSN